MRQQERFWKVFFFSLFIQTKDTVQNMLFIKGFFRKCVNVANFAEETADFITFMHYNIYKYIYIYIQSCESCSK